MIRTWKVKNDKRYPHDTYEISGETITEAVAQNLETILRHTMPDGDRLIAAEDFEVKWSDSIFGGTGGAVAEISAKISNTLAPGSPNYAEKQKVYTAWIYADKEDPDYSLTVKQLREMAGMPRKEFSEYFHISTRTIENWECGRTTPPSYLISLMEYKLRNEGILK